MKKIWNFLWKKDENGERFLPMLLLMTVVFLTVIYLPVIF